MMNATLAFCILALTSSYVPPFLLIVLLRYVNESVSSSGSLHTYRHTSAITQCSHASDRISRTITSMQFGSGFENDESVCIRF